LIPLIALMIIINFFPERSVITNRKRLYYRALYSK
jgi:hypothetical protein